MKAIKVAVVGDYGVGKTSILLKFFRNEFFEDAKPTVGLSFISKVVDTGEEKIKINCWDTAGQEAFRSLVPTYLEASQAVILVFNMTDYESYKNIEYWKNQISESAPNARVYVVGNKCDLNPSEKIPDGDFWRVSAFTGENLETLFSQVVVDCASEAKEESGIPIYDQPVTRKGRCC